jgi:hypothetical protein
MKIELTVNGHRAAGVHITTYGITYTLLGLSLFLGPEPYIGRG